MTIQGMNIEAVRELAGQMDSNADQIQTLLADLGSRLENTEWIGPDRDQFVGEWQGTFVPQLTAVANTLRDTANKARSNAEQQEQASA